MKRKFYLSLHYNHDNSYLFVNRKEIYKFKADKKDVKFSIKFNLESISNKFEAVNSREVSFKRKLLWLFSGSQCCSWIWHIKHLQVFNG